MSTAAPPLAFGTYVRRDAHAADSGWYTPDPVELQGQIRTWLDKAEAEIDKAKASSEGAAGGAAGAEGAAGAAASSAAAPAPPPAQATGPVRAIIAPHAGFRFSGATAAFAYAALRPFPSGVKRVFLLGPSHASSGGGAGEVPAVAFSGASALKTPFHAEGEGLPVDVEACRAVAAAFQEVFKDEGKGGEGTATVGVLTQAADEEEHSLEMHLPFLAHLLRERDEGGGKDDSAMAGSGSGAGRPSSTAVSVVPILLKSARAHNAPDTVPLLGRVFAPFLADPENLFIVSSDWAHWGRRFNFSPTFEFPETDPLGLPGGIPLTELARGISALDHRSMALLEKQELLNFRLHVEKSRTNICGSHALAVFLAAVTELKGGAGAEKDKDGGKKKKAGGKGEAGSAAAGAAGAPAAPAPIHHAITFVKYAQSSTVLTLADSAVSYAAGVVRRTG
jgi:AmmeMemoRadiSam system protein B